MIIETLSRGQGQEAMKEWLKYYPSLPLIDDSLLQIRNDIQTINREIRSEIEKNPSINKPDYYLDYNLGLRLYEYFSTQIGFSLRVASNDGFWRYLSLKVVPDVVAQRWGKDSDSHFWSQPSRIWLRSLWWYIHLCWQGDVESTKKVVSTSFFSTDTILNLEERSGKNGTYVDVYREIVRCYSLVPEEIVRGFKKNGGTKKEDLFRVVMKLNTAKMLVMDPALYLGGSSAYAQQLFNDVGVDI